MHASVVKAGSLGSGAALAIEMGKKDAMNENKNDGNNAKVMNRFVRDAFLKRRLRIAYAI